MEHEDLIFSIYDVLLIQELLMVGFGYSATAEVLDTKTREQVVSVYCNFENLILLKLISPIENIRKVL
jgi:hypothetical protein